MNQPEKLSDSNKTLLQAKWVLGVGFILIIIIPYLLTKQSFIKGFDFTGTGQIGDTIGGITGPVINLLGAILVFLALKAQIEANRLVQGQIDDQRNQYYVSRVTETIDLQINRIDESIKTVLFVFLDPIRREVQGHNGLYLFNESIKQEQIKLIYRPEDLQTDIHILVNNNISQLTEIYDKVSAAVVIIDDLLSDHNLSHSQRNSLSKLLLLNLGENFRDNLEQVGKFINWHVASSTDLDSIYISENQISRLRQLVRLVWSFYERNAFEDSRSA